MNLKRRFCKDESAVSEVVGTILILGITVVLFSSIFATVSRLETPDRTTYTELSAEFNSEDLTILISHKGGRSLDTDRTTIFIVIDDSSKSYTFDMDEVDFAEGDEEDDNWDLGETVIVDVTDDFDWKNVSSAEVLVMNNATNELIWRTEVTVGRLPPRPTFRDVGVYYTPEWKNYVAAGERVMFYAKVSYPDNQLNNLTVTIDISHLTGYEDTIEMDHTIGNEFRTNRIKIDSNQENGTYKLPVNAVDESNNRSAKTDYISLNVGPVEDIREQPDIIVDENRIEFDSSSPTSGESLRLDAVIENEGGSSALVNVTVWDRRPDGENVTAAIIPDIRVAAGGGRDISATWNVNGSGEHNITVDVTEVESPGGENVRPVEEIHASRIIYVEPTILVVDDDPNGDLESKIISNSLRSADFTLDEYIVSGPNADGPSLSTLKRYDVTVWVTGSATDNTLTSTDRDNLKEYMDDGNKLWLIGEGIMEDIAIIDPNFFHDYIGVSSDYEESNAPTEDYVNGTGILENVSFEVQTEGNFNGDYVTPREGARVMLVDGLEPDEDENIVGTSYNNTDENFKVAFNSIQIQSIKSGRSIMAYRIIKWLANMEYKSGTDIAVSDQEFSTRTPMYSEDVDITATIRNNGPFEESVDVRLYINDRLDTTQRRQINLAPNGDSKEVTFNWTAQPVGSHDLVVKADPFNRIEETNEWNNDITYTDFDTTINVQYSVLLVDSDGSEVSERPNTTEYMLNRLDSLGYAYDYFLAGNGESPSTDLMRNYNSVYWIVGNATSNDDPIISEDELQNIQSYLDENTFVSFYLEGHRILRDIIDDHGTDGQEFIRNYLGIAPESISELDSPPSVLEGVDDDEITHGMEYNVESYWSEPEFFSLDVDGGEVIYTDENRNNIASRYENEDNDFKTVYSGMGLAHFEGPNVDDSWFDDFAGPVNTSTDAAREEFTYMMTKWFGNQDESIELRVSDADISISSKNPILGRSYLLTASIQNAGFTGTNALVRFKDGDNLIASESLYVPPDGFSTAEVTWQPLFAGPNRPIRVLVDPLLNVNEIGNEGGEEDYDTMGFNNHAFIRKEVFFFWDDMENGAANWNHESTIANINGEQPLEFLSEEYEEVYTDIVSEWDEEMSHNVTMTDQFSYSDPNSYWMAEPKAEEEKERVPLDMALVLDTTGSMSGQPMTDMQEAAKDLIDMYDENDRVALFRLTAMQEDSDPNYPYLVKELAYMTEENKNEFKNEIDSWSAEGGTPLWDSGGSAITYTVENWRSGTPFEDFVPSVMLFTDGDDQHYSYNWPSRSYEAGSDEYCPGSYSGDDYNTHTWGTSDGNVWGDQFDYINQGPSSGDDVKRYIPEEDGVEWITLLDSDGDRTTTRKGLLENPTLTFTVGLGVRDLEQDDPDFPFTGEYQLIEIAESTEGKYWYAPDSDELGVIFEQVFEEAAKEAEAGELTSVELNSEEDTPSSSSYNELGLMETKKETRYFRADNILGITQSNRGLESESLGNNKEVYAGIKVWIRDSNGTETEITEGAPVGIGRRGANEGEGIVIGSTWKPDETDLNPTDSIVIRLYQGTESPPDELIATFTTEELDANQLVSSEWTPHYWIKSISGESSVVGWGSDDYNTRIEGFTYVSDNDDEDSTDPAEPIYGENENKTAITPALDLRGYSDASLTFMHKYRMVSGSNGGFIMVGWEDEDYGGEDGWAWRYVNKPSRGTYNGNLKLDIEEDRTDDFGNEITYAWTGVSGGGSFSWDPVRINLLRYVPEENRDSVKIKFNYTQYGGGTGYGWYFDNVRVTVSRDGHYLDSINDNTKDVWHLNQTTGWNGESIMAWKNADPDTGYFCRGIDNSLVTTSIDLTNARTATLSAYLKFNINEESGAPPDGFRVEITMDGGLTWMPINVGVRSGYGISGSGEDGSNQGANVGHNWTTTESLSRLDVDLSDFSGSVVRIRFRVVTTNAEGYDHYQDEDADGGFYIGQVVVNGSSSVEEG